MGKKIKSISKLKKEADRVFSLWVRARESRCVTCGGKNDQCGHFISRSHNILRYDKRNGHSQCVGCNIFKSGNYPAYTQFMLKTYGPDIIDKLLKEKQKLHQFTRSELESIITTYQNLIK